MTSRLKLFLVAALACTALLSAIPSGASARRGMEVAVQDDSALVTELGTIGDRVIALDLARGLNASYIRANVNWSYVIDVPGTGQRDSRKEPKTIKYNWTGYDDLVAGAAARGMKVQLALTGPAPRWATSNHRIGPVGIKPKPFARFAFDAAHHFAGNVNRYSIWNEPNYVSWLSPLSKGPKLYRALYTAGYKAIKSANPGASVLIAETSPYALPKRATAPLKFLRGVTCANSRYKRAKKCSTLLTDGVAHHPYDFRHKPSYRYPGKDNVTLATLSRLTTALSKLRKAKLLRTPSGGVPYLYLTEWGYFASGKYKVSEKKRAAYLVSGFKKALANPHVKQMLQFTILKPDPKYLVFATYIASKTGVPMLAYKKLKAWAASAARAHRIARPG